MRRLALLFLLASVVGCGDQAGDASTAAGGTAGGSAGGEAPSTAGAGTNSGGAGVAGSSSNGGGGSPGNTAGSAAIGGSAGMNGGSGGTANAAQPTFKVMTFNIRYGSAPDGENAWAIRKPLAFDVFKRQAADMVGVQEALDAQLVDIDGAVPGYARIGVGRDDGMKKGEYSAIYYKTDRFMLDDSGTFWFSDTPEVPGSKSWGNDITRICSWGHFTEKATGYGFYHFNVHLDHMSQPSREKSAALLMKRVVARPIATDTVIVTGDFNATETNLATMFMQGKGKVDGADNPLPLVDSYRAMYPDEKDVLTAHAFNGGTAGGKIDYVYMAPGQKALAAEIDRTEVDGHYPSDHYPVTGTIQLPKAP